MQSCSYHQAYKRLRKSCFYKWIWYQSSANNNMAELIIFIKKKLGVLNTSKTALVISTPWAYMEKKICMEIYIFYPHAKFLYKVPSTYLPHVP